jgi:hypothetical protein
VVPETRGGRQALERASRGRPVSAHGLLSGDWVGEVADLEVYVPPELLADLHDPRLVITPGYIGRDRRRPATARWGDGNQPRSQLLLVVMVALLTSAIVVPLTLALAPRGVSAVATDPVRTHAPARGTDAASAPRTPKARSPRPKPSTNCDLTVGPAASPLCVRRQQASQRREALAAQRVSRSEERATAEAERQAERQAAQAARSATRAARIAARHPAGAPAT